MRNPDRLNDFYDRLKIVHKERHSDLRFGQLITCVFANLQVERRDPFYMEEDEIIKYIEGMR